MSFIAELCRVCQQARQSEQLQITVRVLNEFKHQCMIEAQRGSTRCCYTTQGLERWRHDQEFVHTFEQVLQNQTRATFGAAAMCNVVRQPMDDGIEISFSIDLPLKALRSTELQAGVNSTVTAVCPVCLEMSKVVALTPCGHLMCTECIHNLPAHSACPVCRHRMIGHQNLFR